MEESTATVPKDVPLQPESTASAAQPYYGRPPPSPLSGGYLLIVISEPLTDAHKAVILQKLAKAFLSWNVEDSGIDIERELAIVTALSPEGDFAKNGERLIQNASEHLVTEILIHPQINTMRQCIRNLLSSFTKYRFIIHAGYVFCGNGSWILQDGTFSVSDFIDAFQEIEVQRVIRAYEKTVKIDICCIAEGGWTQSRLQQEPFSKLCQVEINPSDKIAPGNVAVREFVDYLEQYIIPSSIEHLLEPSDIVGNIRFTHPTLYVFPGGEGDAALFGINGFNMLVDGGFGKKACFWNFVRHLDRLDAVLMTRVNNSNIGGMSGVVERKVFSHVYPQVGHFFCNLQGRKQLPSPDGDKDREPLLVNLIEEGDRMVMNLKQLQLKPHHCYRDATSDPINLYHKVGHGRLDMYVISPAKDSREVKEFLSRWNNHDVKLFSGTSKTGSRELRVPLQNLVSICALLVWQPANPDDKITRILFPGSTPQHKIFEGLERLKPLEFLKHSTCTVKSVIPAQTPLVSKPAAKKFVSKLDKQEKILDELAKSEAQVKSALAGNENETDSGPRSLPVDLQASAGGAIKSTITKSKRTVVKSTEKAVMKDIKSKTDQIKEKSSVIDGTFSDKSTADSQNSSGVITKESIVEKKKFERKPVQRPTVAPPPKPKASTPSNEEKKSIESEKSSSPTTPKKSFPEKKSAQVKSTVITGQQQKYTESKDQSTAAVTSASTISSTTTTVEKESSASVTTSKEQSKASSTTITTTTTTKPISRPAPRTRTPPKVFPAKSLKDENNRKVAESKPTRTAPTKIIATSKPIKKDEEPIVKAEKKPIVKRAKPPAAPVQNQAVAKPAPAKPSSPVKVARKPITSRKLNLGDDKKFKPDNERTDSSAVSTPSTLEADTTLLKTKAKSESVKLAKDTSTKSTAIKKIRPKPKPTETQSIKTSTESVPTKPTAPVAERTTHVSKIITKQGDDEEDEILIIETTEMKPISKQDYEEQKHLRDQIESEKEQKEKDHDVCKSKLEQSLDFAQVNETKKPQINEKVAVMLTPEDKEKIFGEVQGIITTAAEMIATAKPATDQKSATPADKPESIPQAKEPVHGSQETSSTTAPTMPEDEKIDFEEHKQQEEIEEKYDKEDTKEKSSENGQHNKIDAQIPLVEQKSEEVIRKAKRDIVKTPDEVADLPVHEEVDIPDYDETTEGEDHFVSSVTTEEPVIEVLKPEHPEYVTITPTSSPDEKPLPAMASDTIQKTTSPVEKTAASKKHSITETKLSKNIINEAEIISKSSQDATQNESNLVSDEFITIDLHSSQLKSLPDTSPNDESSQKDKDRDAVSPHDSKCASKEISPSTDKKSDINKLEIGKDDEKQDKASPQDGDEPAKLTKPDEKLSQSFRKESLKSPDEKLKSSETKRSSITDDEKIDQLSPKESAKEFVEEASKLSDIKRSSIAKHEKLDQLSRNESLKEFPEEASKSSETKRSSIVEDGEICQLSRKQSLKEFLEDTPKSLEAKQSSMVEDEDLGHSSRKQSLKEFMEETPKPSEMKRSSIKDNEKLDHMSRKESLKEFLEETPKSTSTKRFSIAEDEKHGQLSQKQSPLEEAKSSETKPSSMIEDEKLEQSPQKESSKEFLDETSLRKESLKVLQKPSAKLTSPSEDKSDSNKATPSPTKSEESLNQSQRKESLQEVLNETFETLSEKPSSPAGHQVDVDKASTSPTESAKLSEKSDQLQEKESSKGFESKTSLFTIDDLKTTKSPTESSKLDEKLFQSSRKESLKEFLDESSKVPLEKLHSSRGDEPCSDRSSSSPTKSPKTPDELQRKESLKLPTSTASTEIRKLDEKPDLKSSEELSPSKKKEFLKETLTSPEKSDQSQETSKSLEESVPLQRKESLKEFSKSPEKSDQSFRKESLKETLKSPEELAPLQRKESLKELSKSPEKSDQSLRKESLKETLKSPEESHSLQRKESLKELSKSPEKTDQSQRAESPEEKLKAPDESNTLQKKESLKEPLKTSEKSEPLQRKESLKETAEHPEKPALIQRKESLKEPLKSPETPQLSQKNESPQETTTFEISTEICSKTTNEKSSPVEKQQSIDKLKSTTVLSSSSFNDATKSARKQSVTFNDESLEIIPSEDLSNDQFTICKSKLRKRSVTDENFLDDEDDQISPKLESPGSEKESQTIHKTTTSKKKSISPEATDTTIEDIPSFDQKLPLTTTKDSTKLEKSPTQKSHPKDFDESPTEKPSTEDSFKPSEPDSKDSSMLTGALKEQKLPPKQASSFEKSSSPSSDITKLPKGEDSSKAVEDSTLTKIIKDSAFDAHEIVTMVDKKSTETSISLDAIPETIKDESNSNVAELDSKHSFKAFKDQPASEDTKHDDKDSSLDETVEKSKIRKESLPKPTDRKISITEALQEPNNKQDSRKPSLTESFEQSTKKDSLKIDLNDTLEEPISSKDEVTKIEDVTKQDSKRASLTTSPEQSTGKDSPSKTLDTKVSLTKSLQESIPLEKEADTKNVTTHDTRELSPIKSLEKATRKESSPTTDEKLDMVSKTITKQDSKEKSELEQTIKESISLNEENDSTKSEDRKLEKLPTDEKLDLNEAAGKQKSVEPISKEQDTLTHSDEKIDANEVTEKPILTPDTSVFPDEKKSSSTVFKQESKEGTPTEPSKISFIQEKTGEKDLASTKAFENVSQVTKSSLKDDESTSQSLKSPTLTPQSEKTTPEKSLPVDEILKLKSKTDSETKLSSPEKEKLAPSQEKSNETKEVISTQSIEKQDEQTKTDTKSEASVEKIKENEKVLDTHTKSPDHSLSEPPPTKDPKDKQQPDHKQSSDLKEDSSFESIPDSQSTSKTQFSLNKEFADSKSKMDTKSSPDSEKIDQPSISSPSLESSLSFEQRTIEEACKSEKSPLDKSSSISDATDARKSSMDTFAWETSPVKIADSKPTNEFDIKEHISITSTNLMTSEITECTIKASPTLKSTEKEVMDGSASEVISSKDTKSDDTTKTSLVDPSNVEIEAQKESLDIASMKEPTDSSTQSRKQSIISDFPEIDPRKENILSQSQKDGIDSDLQQTDLRRSSISSESRKSSTIADLHQLNFDAIHLSKSPPKDFSVDRKDSLNNSSIQEKSNELKEFSYSISQTSQHTSPQPDQSIIKSDSSPTPITRKESLKISPEASQSRKSSVVLEFPDSTKHSTALEQTSTKGSTHISKSSSKESIQSEDMSESLTDKNSASPDTDIKQVECESFVTKSPSNDSRKDSLALHSSPVTETEPSSASSYKESSSPKISPDQSKDTSDKKSKSPITETEPSSASSHKKSSSQKISPDQSKDITVLSSTDKKSQEKLPDSFTQSQVKSLDINSKPDSSKLTNTISKEFTGASIDTTSSITQDSSPEPSPSKELSSKSPETPVTETQSSNKSPSSGGDAKLYQPTITSDITKEAADEISPTSQSSLETSPSKDKSPKKPDTDGHSRKESIVLDSKRNSYIFQSRASTESIAGSIDDDFDSRSLPRGSVDIHSSKSFQATPTEIIDLTKHESITSESRKGSLADSSSTTKTITESTFISSSTKYEDEPKIASKRSSIISDSQRSSIAYEFDKDNVDFHPTTESSSLEKISPTTKSPSDDSKITSQKSSPLEDSTVSIGKRQDSAIDITDSRKSSITVDSIKPSVQLDQNTDSPRSSVIIDSRKSSLQLDQHDISPITKSITETSTKEGTESRKSSIQLDTRRSSIAADSRKPSLQLDQPETSITKSGTKTSPKESTDSRKSSIQLDQTTDSTRNSIVADSRKASLQLDQHDILTTKPANEISPKDSSESRKSSIQLGQSPDSRRSSIVADSRKPSLQLDQHETSITKPATETSPRESTDSRKSSIQLDLSPDSIRSSILADSRKASLQLDQHTSITKPVTETSQKESPDSRKSSIQLDQHLDSKRSSIVDSRKASLQHDQHTSITKPTTETSSKEGTESPKASIQLDTRRSSIGLQLDQHDTLITEPATETSPKEGTDSRKSSIQQDQSTAKRSSISSDSRKPSLQLDQHDTLITEPATETSPKEGTDSRKSSIQQDQSTAKRSSISSDSRKPSLQLDQHDTLITEPATDTSPSDGIELSKSSVQLDNTDLRKSSLQLHQQGISSFTEPITEISSPSEEIGSQKSSFSDSKQEILLTQTNQENQKIFTTESQQSTISESYLDHRKDSLTCNLKEESLKTSSDPLTISQTKLANDPSTRKISTTSILEPAFESSLTKEQIISDSRKSSLATDSRKASLGLDLGRVTSTTVDTFSEAESVITSTNDDHKFRKTSLPSDFGKTISSVKLEKPTNDPSCQKQKDIEVLSPLMTSTITETTTTTTTTLTKPQESKTIHLISESTHEDSIISESKHDSPSSDKNFSETETSPSHQTKITDSRKSSIADSRTGSIFTKSGEISDSNEPRIDIPIGSFTIESTTSQISAKESKQISSSKHSSTIDTITSEKTINPDQISSTDSSKSISTLSESHKTSQSAESASHIADSLTETTSEFITQSITSTSGSNTTSSTESSTISKLSTDEGSLKDKAEMETFMTKTSKDEKASEFTSTDVLTAVSSIPTIEKDVKLAITSSAVDTNTTSHKTFITSGQTRQFTSSVTSTDNQTSPTEKFTFHEESTPRNVTISSSKQQIIVSESQVADTSTKQNIDELKKNVNTYQTSTETGKLSSHQLGSVSTLETCNIDLSHRSPSPDFHSHKSTTYTFTTIGSPDGNGHLTETTIPRQDLGYVEQLDVTQSNLKSSIPTEQTGKLLQDNNDSTNTNSHTTTIQSHTSELVSGDSEKSATTTTTTRVVSSQSPLKSTTLECPITETTKTTHVETFSEIDPSSAELVSGDSEKSTTTTTTTRVISSQSPLKTTTLECPITETTRTTHVETFSEIDPSSAELVSGDSEKSTTTTTTTRVISSQSPLKTTTLEGPITETTRTTHVETEGPTTETTRTTHVETFSEFDPSSVDLAQFTSLSSSDLPHPGVSTADGRYSTIEYQTITKYVVIPSADGSPSRIRKYTTEIIPTSVREMSRAEYEKLDDVSATSDAQQEPSTTFKPALREMDSKSYDSFTQFHPTSTTFTTVKHDAVTKSISEPKIQISPDSGALHMDANQMRVQFLADSSASGATSATKKSATGAAISKSSSDETYDATASDTLSDLSSNKFHKREVVSKTVSLPILDEVAKPGAGSIGQTDPSEDVSRSMTCLEKIAYTEGTKQAISSDPSSLNKQPGEGELQLKSASLPVIKRPDDSEKFMTLPNLYKTTNLEDLTAEDTIIEEKVISSETSSSVKVDSTSGLISSIKEADELTEDDNQSTYMKKVIETTTKITSHLVGGLQPDSSSPQRSQTPCSEDRESDDNRSDISLEQCSRITQHSGGAGRDSSQICESDEDDEFVESMNTQSNLPHFKEDDPIQHPLSSSEMETMRTMSSSMTQSFYGTYPEDDDDELPEDCRGSSMSTSVHHSTQDSTKDDTKDPIKDWGRPLGLPNVKNIDKLLIWNPIEEWGRPFGLPTPAPPPPSVQERESNGDIEINLAPINPPTNNVTKGTPTKKVPKKPTVAEKMNTARETSKTRDSSIKRAKPTKPTSPIYVDLAYVPHHGNPYYTTVEFFKRIRARYYVFSGTDPSKDVFNALIDAKKTWEDQNLEVTIIPTYDTDVLGYWITENEETLLNLKIDLSPSASRCTINLQDHDTSCSAYRLEF